MKTKIILLLILSVLLTQNCAPKKRRQKIEITSEASSYQKTGPEGELISEKKHMVSLSYNTDKKLNEMAKGKTILRMTIENRGNEPVKIGNENISIIFDWQNKERASKEIRIQTLDLFMNELEIGQCIGEYYAINKVLNNNNKVDRKWIHPFGMLGELTYMTMNEIPNKYEVLDGFGKMLEKTAENIEKTRTEFARHKESLPLIFLKSKTIMPGEVYLGIVACDTRGIEPQTKGNLRVVVSIDGENHEFTFSRGVADFIPPP